jgi:mono/diheme cytochrome c family protein
LARWPRTDASGSRRGSNSAALVGVAAICCASTVWQPAATQAADAAELTFTRHSKPVAIVPLAALRELYAPEDVRVLEPYEDREASFRAIRLSAVLDAIYSPSWRTEEEVLFTCRDGYQPGVPVARLLAHEAWLAFARVGRPDFSIEKLESGQRRRVALSPFYLIWENLADAQLRADGDYGWPYQLVEIDLIRTADRFPNMVPPAAASEQVLSGFRAFRVHCSRCHRINGDGGTIGQELVRPVGPSDYRSKEWLRRWIDDPSAVVPTARMPRLNPSLGGREQAVNDILAYLDAMTRARDAASGAAEGG